MAVCGHMENIPSRSEKPKNQAVKSCRISDNKLLGIFSPIDGKKTFSIWGCVSKICGGPFKTAAADGTNVIWWALMALIP